MSVIDKILTLFGESTPISKSENFSLFESVYELKKPEFTIDLSNSIIEVFSILEPKNIDLTLTIIIDSQDPTYIVTGDYKSISQKILDLKNKIDLVEENEKITIEFRADKSSSDHFNIFDINEFAKYLNTLTLEESLGYWCKLKCSSILNIDVWEEVGSFSTTSIIFQSVFPVSPTKQCTTVLSDDKRVDRIYKRDKCGHFANAALFNFLPDDFIVLDGKLPIQFEEHFLGILNAALIIFLSDFSSIESNELKYRLKGYKLLSENIDFNSLKCVDLNELKKVYEWTYLEGNFTDKIGLSRNIITIHIEGESILSVENGTSNSVESGYDLYLKENVKQYIDIKNKISEFIQGQSDKALEITKNMFSMFKTGLWTFATFFITIFLLRVVSKGQLSEAFSFEAMIVSFLLIIFSFIFLFISVHELNSDRDRLLTKYSDIRNRYKELINKNDLDKIINEDEIKAKEHKYINDKRNIYITAWIITNLILAAAVVFLYAHGQTHTVDHKAHGSGEKDIIPKVNDQAINLPVKPKLEIPDKSEKASPSPKAENKTNPKFSNTNPTK